MRKLTQKDYRLSRWSGGETLQLAIAPLDAVYADRDFLWRVSSATVELEESEFTALPDYDRLIATLREEISLTHNGGAPLTLRPYEVHGFSGGEATHSSGRCTDFNLMLRRGRATGSMEALRPGRTPQELTACPGQTLLLYCAEGSCRVRLKQEETGEELSAGQTLLLTGPAALTLTGSGVLMLCRMQKTEA